MQPIDFPESNIVFEAGANPNTRDVVGWQGKEGDGPDAVDACVLLFEPSEEERAAIAAGAPVWLVMRGSTLRPVRLQTESPFAVDEAQMELPLEGGDQACPCTAWARTSPEDWHGDHHRLCHRAEREKPFSMVATAYRTYLYDALKAGDAAAAWRALMDHTITCESSTFYSDTVVQERLEADRSCPECGETFFFGCLCPELYTICTKGHGWEMRDGHKRVIAIAPPKQPELAEDAADDGTRGWPLVREEGAGSADGAS